MFWVHLIVYFIQQSFEVYECTTEDNLFFHATCGNLKKMQDCEVIAKQSQKINKEPQNETAVSVLLGPEASVSTEFNQKCATITFRPLSNKKKAQWTMAQLC